MTVWFIFETALTESAISSAGISIEILHWIPFYVLKREGHGLWFEAHGGTLRCLNSAPSSTFALLSLQAYLIYLEGVC